MPSTPRMIEIERKASQPGGPALTREEVAEWHREHAPIALRGGRPWLAALMVSNAPLIDYSAANRYLDTQKPQK